MFEGRPLTLEGPLDPCEYEPAAVCVTGWWQRMHCASFDILCSICCNRPYAHVCQCRLLGCPEGRSAKTWVDFNFWGHQIVAHLVKGYNASSSANQVRLPAAKFLNGACMQQSSAREDRVFVCQSGDPLGCSSRWVLSMLRCSTRNAHAGAITDLDHASRICFSL